MYCGFRRSDTGVIFVFDLEIRESLELVAPFCGSGW